MNTKLEFLYLNEEDCIKAGVQDMHSCVEVMEEVFRLMGEGDYRMGGTSGQAHGLGIRFPKQSPFPNMPLDGPDRRFMAMPCYLGGRFDIAGLKWYGSNRDNVKKGLPRSILMITLNDKDTGAPKAYMSANLISSVRTGAIPGVGAKYLARPESEVVSLIGAGVIGRSCLYSLLDVLKQVKQVRIYDIFPESAERVCAEIQENYGVESIPVSSMEAAFKDADVVNFAVSGKDRPVVEPEWIKPGIYLSLPSKTHISPQLAKDSCIVLDNWPMYKDWCADLIDLPGGCIANNGLLGGYMMDYVHQGVLTEEDITSLGEIICGKRPGRTDDGQNIIFGMGGQPSYDVAWADTIYEKAKEMGLGITLKIWDKPKMH